MRSVTVRVVGGASHKKMTLLDGAEKNEYNFYGEEITIHIPNGVHWTPDTPYLYKFKLTAGDDCVESYFALREISIEKKDKSPAILLNRKPVFLHGVLDQGYFSDGIYPEDVFPHKHK